MFFTVAGLTCLGVLWWNSGSRRERQARDRTAGLTSQRSPDAAISRPLPAADTGLALVDDLLVALAEGNQDQVDALTKALSNLRGPKLEEKLWDALLDESTSHRHLLRLGTILGRVGTDEALRKTHAMLREISSGSNDLTYGANGVPTRGRALLNALASNTIREFLRRDGYAELALELSIEFSFESGIQRSARRVMLLALVANGATGRVLPTLTARFEGCSSEERSDVVAAMYSCRAPEAAPVLLDWYERYPSQRRGLADAIAAALPTAVAIKLLRARLESDGADALHLLKSLELVGRQRNASYTDIEAAFEESIGVTRQALLRAAVATRDARAQRLLLQAAQHDPEPRVRASAFELIGARLDPPAAFVVLSTALASERDATAKGGVRRALLIVAGTSERGREARRSLVADLPSCRGAAGLDHVRSLISYSKQVGFWDELSSELERQGVLGHIRDTQIRDLLRKEIGAAKK